MYALIYCFPSLSLSWRESLLNDAMRWCDARAVAQAETTQRYAICNSEVAISYSIHSMYAISRSSIKRLHKHKRIGRRMQYHNLLDGAPARSQQWKLTAHTDRVGVAVWSLLALECAYGRDSSIVCSSDHIFSSHGECVLLLFSLLRAACANSYYWRDRFVGKRHMHELYVCLCIILFVCTMI